MSNCAECGNPIPETRRSHARLCSYLCERARNKRMFEERNPLPAEWSKLLSAGKAGAVQELLVAADLLKRGISVFRAVSPAEICDLMIIANGSFYRVEVTTGNLNRNGTFCHAKNTFGSRRFDILAVVKRGTGQITYMPGLSNILNEKKTP